ncbi:MAG: DUF799 domain-containing protein [Candidatus Nitrotoga sp.]
MNSILLKLTSLLFIVILATGCATQQKPYDYSAYKQSNPRSILVLPPINNTPDVKATYSMLSQMTYPLAESGYYVFPVTLVDESFRQNGLNNPAEIHAVSPVKLREIFGANAALYVTITRYGASYTVIKSQSVVSASAKLLDLKTGQLLWEGSASASSQENNNQSGGLAELLISAIVTQVVSSVVDASHPVAGIASNRLLLARPPNGILYGPRSPKYGSD